MPGILVGFAAGLFAFAALMRWVALVAYAFGQVRQASGEPNRGRAVALAICQSLFHSGPWGVVTIAFVAYQVRQEPWAPWLFGGFGLSFLLMGVTTVQLMLRMRSARRET